MNKRFRVTQVGNEGNEESVRQTASSCRSRPLRRSRLADTQLHEDTNVVVQAFAQEA